MTSRIRILVVEDEAILAEDLRESLERQSYHVVGTVDNAADARAYADRERPDLVMMDIHLAGGDDGISTAAHLREVFDLPVIFLTAHSDQATLDRAKHTSPYGYLVKPFEDQELRASIETAIYRHKSDAQLRRMERWLRTTLHSIGDGVITVDLDRRITFINPVAERITGWSRQAAIGCPYDHVFALHDDLNQRVPDPIAPVLSAGESLHFDQSYTIDTKDGHRRRIDDSIAPIRDEQGSINGAIIIFRDATEKWELEQLRQQSEQRMQEAQKLESLGVLAAGIAHDFNNLLAIIVGHAELMQMQDPVHEENRECLAQICGAGHRAAQLCEQMLTYAESGQFELKPIDLRPILDTTARLAPRSFSGQIEVKLDLPANLPPVRGHIGRLQQLFTNLVLNGAEAMCDRPGTIELIARTVDTLPANLRVAPERAEPARTWLRVVVEDHGLGIPASTLERIFDPFFSTKFAGRGLGLSIVYNVVRLHDAGLAVHSQIGVGTRFEIYLPVVAGDSVAPAAIIPAQDWRPARPGRIVIIDDEVAVSRTLADMLKRYGFSCQVFNDPQEIVAQAKTLTEVQTVFLDLTMPEMSGIEVQRRLREVWPTLPIVLTTGFAEASVTELIATDEHTHFLGKPFSFGSLVSVLKKLRV